jgi:uncharacterized SAM-binding protein YcdF (DUF218 family)
VSFSVPIWFVFSSGGAAVAMTVVVVLLLRSPTRRGVRRFASGLAAFYLVASIYAIPEACGRLLTTGFAPLQPTQLPDRDGVTLVVLGSGSVTVRDWDGRAYATNDPSASARVLEAIRLFRMLPSATVISSGGLLNANGLDTPTGEAMAAALRTLGVPESQLLVETIARNTHEEALVVGRMLRERPPGPVVLVTVDVHMRRALGTFRAAGIDAIAAIARPPEADTLPASRWLPSDRGLWYSGLIAHELLGLAYYALRGWFSVTPAT